MAVGIVRAELRAFARIEPALEQRAEDRRIDLRPVEVRSRQYRLDVSGLQWERRTVVEQSAVEPGDRSSRFSTFLNPKMNRPSAVRTWRYYLSVLLVRDLGVCPVDLTKNLGVCPVWSLGVCPCKTQK